MKRKSDWSDSSFIPHPSSPPSSSLSLYRSSFRQDPRRPLLLLILILFFLVAAARSLVSRRTSEPAEFSLLSCPSSSTFNSTSAEAQSEFTNRAPQRFDGTLSSLPAETATGDFPILVACQKETSALPEPDQLPMLKPAPVVALTLVPVENSYLKQETHQGASPM